MLFTKENYEQVANQIKTELEQLVPHVQVRRIIGYDSMFIRVLFDKKETWANGIMENSGYITFAFESDGTLEISQKSVYRGGYVSIENRIPVKFRKQTAKSVDEVILRMSKCVNEVKIEINK